MLFLDTSLHLYKRLYPSVGPQVGLSIGLLVRNAIKKSSYGNAEDASDALQGLLYLE